MDARRSDNERKQRRRDESNERACVCTTRWMQGPSVPRHESKRSDGRQDRLFTLTLPWANGQRSPLGACPTRSPRWLRTELHLCYLVKKFAARPIWCKPLASTWRASSAERRSPVQILPFAMHQYCVRHGDSFVLGCSTFPLFSTSLHCEECTHLLCQGHCLYFRL